MPAPGPGRPGVAAVLALSGGRRWGWGGGLVTFAPPRLPRPGPLVPWPRRRSLPPSPQARPRGASSRASHRARRRREGLPESRRESATSPQDGGRHHRDSPRRAPSPTRKKTRRMGPDPGGLSRRGGAATQCAGVNRNSARESEAGRWAAPECPWRAAGVRRRTWRAAALGAASSRPPASRRPAYVQAPPSGPNCAIRSRGTATWRPAGVDAEQGAWNPEGGGAGGASVEGLSGAGPGGAHAAGGASVMRLASLILRH